MPEHWGPRESAWVTPEDELFDAEMGNRVGWEAILADLTFADKDPERRGQSVMIMMVRQVAEGTRLRGWPFPEDWKWDDWQWIDASET